MADRSDSDDSENLLSDPLRGLRKPKNHLSSQQGTADCNISISNTYSIRSNNLLSRSKLSLTQRKRLSQTYFEPEDSSRLLDSTLDDNGPLPKSAMNTKVVRQLTPTESTPLKKFKAELLASSSSSSSSSPIPASQQVKAKAPVVIRRSQQQQPIITEAAESPIEFREIKVPSSDPTQSSGMSLSLVFEPSPESTQVQTIDSQSTIPFISTGITPEELPPMDPAKIDLVQKWLDRCEPDDVVLLSSDDEKESTPHQITGPSSPEESQEIPQGSVTPKRNPMNNPTTVASSTGKQTAITAFFTPRSSVTVVHSTVEDQPKIRIPSNVNMRELNMDGPLSGSSSCSTINQQEEVQRNGRAEWSSLMSKMRGGAAATVRRRTTRNNSREEQEAAEPKEVGKCPFYRLIPGTGFAVDAFNYGRIKGVTHYFLSHYHYDHYRGLGKWLDKPMYCSKVTANLVLMNTKVDANLVRVLPLNESRVISGIEVILFDANHCPGAVMFLFRFITGRTILHVGDFRAHSSMESLKELNYRPIDELYLDTTYCDRNYELPPQEEVLRYVRRLVRKYVNKHPKLLVVCGSYTIGKEKVFMAAAEELNCKVWAPSDKRRVLKCLEDPEVSKRLVENPKAAQVHVRNMKDVKPPKLKSMLDELKSSSTHILALNPTGWEFDNKTASKGLDSIAPKVIGNVYLHGVPYSEHSGFTEMRRFVIHFNPGKIVPTVNVGTRDSRTKMELIFREWLGRSPF